MIGNIFDPSIYSADAVSSNVAAIASLGLVSSLVLVYLGFRLWPYALRALKAVLGRSR